MDELTSKSDQTEMYIERTMLKVDRLKRDSNNQPISSGLVNCTKQLNSMLVHIEETMVSSTSHSRSLPKKKTGRSKYIVRSPSAQPTSPCTGKVERFDKMKRTIHKVSRLDSPASVDRGAQNGET